MLRAVLLAACAAGSSAIYPHVKGSDDRIVPDVINRYGNVKLNIVVTSNDGTRSLPLVKGMHIMPEFVALPPKIEWYCRPDQWFTMVLTGPDNPSRGVRRTWHGSILMSQVKAHHKFSRSELALPRVAQLLPRSPTGPSDTHEAARNL